MELLTTILQWHRGLEFTVLYDARPRTPELRVDREALSRIHFLRDQGQPQSEWLAAFSAASDRGIR